MYFNIQQTEEEKEHRLARSLEILAENPREGHIVHELNRAFEEQAQIVFHFPDGERVVITPPTQSHTRN